MSSMQIMRPTTDQRDTMEMRVVIESAEHEELVFEATSQDELDAKLEDFLTWAS